MKTVILLCCLATFARAIPTLIKGTFNELGSTPHEPYKTHATIKREKKSTLHDSVYEETSDHEKEIPPSNIGVKSHIIAPVFEGRSLGFKKPLIIKKKFGYHLYRDSDEEMAYGNPNENCRNQVKVKLCDDEQSINTNKLSKSTKSAGLDISEKEVEHSIKMAKEAVENLQRNIKKMEESSMKFRENSKNENLASDTEVQEDIETARKALEHITQNFETLESMESPRMHEDILTPKSTDDTDERLAQWKDTDERLAQWKDTDERLAQWKDAIENINKNFEIARNIEDTFRFESLNSFSAENSAATKLTESHISKIGEHEVQEKSNNEFLDDGKSDLKSEKNVNEEEKIETLSDSPIGKSSSLEEQRVENDDDMFTSTSNNKQFNIELHSDSLKQEKAAIDLVDDNVEKEALINDDTRMVNLEEQLLQSKNAEEVIDDQPHKLNAPNTQTSGKNSMSDFTFEHLEKQAIAEIENKEIPYLAKEANDENTKLSENDDHKPKSKSSAVNSDFQVHEEIKELFNIDKPNYDNMEDLFMPKEAINTDKTFVEVTNTNIRDMHEKDADEQLNEEKRLSVPLKESHNEIKMRESLDISTTPKENKLYNEKEHTSGTLDENLPSDNLFRSENIEASQGTTNEDTEEIIHLQGKHAIVKPASSITPINLNKQQTTNDHLSTTLAEHDTMGRTIITDLDSQGTNMLRSVLESNNFNTDDAAVPTMANSYNIQQEHLNTKMNHEENNDFDTLRSTQENEFETKNHNLKIPQNIVNEKMDMRMAEDHTKAQSILGNQAIYDSQILDLTHLIQDSDNIDPKFKTVATDANKESHIPTTKNLSDQHVHINKDLFSMRNTGDLGMERETVKNVDQHELHFMQKPLHRSTLFPMKGQSDGLPQEFKSASNFHDDKGLLTPSNNIGLNINQRLFNGKQDVRMTEDSNIEEYLSQNRNLQVTPTSRWSEDRKLMDDESSLGFKSATNLPNRNSFLKPLSMGTERYDDDHMMKEQTNMRMNEGRYTGQQYNYNNNHQFYDMQPMGYMEDKQHTHVTQLYNNPPEFQNNHYRPYLQQHGHGYGYMNRFNQFELDNNQDLSSFPSRNHDHMNSMRENKMSELDSSMQPSSQMNMRDNGLQRGHHHGMSRTAFGTSLPIAGVSPGAVGVFPTANTGCGIPLMLSCSPSVVSGSLAKAHPSIPAFRSDDDIMYYMKRDAKNIDETPVKIQRTPFNHKTEMILNKQ